MFSRNNIHGKTTFAREIQRKGFATERREHMGTGGGPEKEKYDNTPEVHEIVQPKIIELTNICNSDGISLEQPINLTHKLMNITATNSTNNYIFLDHIESDRINKNINCVQYEEFISNIPCQSTENRDEKNSENISCVQYKEIMSNNLDCQSMENTNKNNSENSIAISTNKTKLDDLSIKNTCTSKKSLKSTVNEKADLRVKKLKTNSDYETTLYKLQIQYQKSILEGLLAKRAEENNLYKLKKEKLILKIENLKSVQTKRDEI